MGLSKRAGEEESDDIAAEAASIESSVRLAEQMARMADFEAEGWPTKKTLLKAHAKTVSVQHEKNPAPAQASDDLVAEAASIEYSVRLTEQIARETGFEGWSARKSFLGRSEVKESRVWPGLKGRTAKELRREAKYHMYYVYEHYPEEMKNLALQVIIKGCSELDEKGAKNFVNKVWANKRLQENLQGAMNATYYRELFDAEEKRIYKRSVPEIYLDGENPQIIFSRMKTFLFRNMDLLNRIYLVKTRKSYNKPLPKQLYELFEAEKSKAARRMRNRQRFYR
jgi:hypothetical protein